MLSIRRAARRDTSSLAVWRKIKEVLNGRRGTVAVPAFIMARVIINNGF